MKVIKENKILVGLTLLPIIVCVAFYGFLPDQIPAHFNMQFEVDRYGSKMEMLLFPLIILAFGIGMLIYRYFECKREDTSPNPRVTNIVIVCTMMLFNIIFIGMLYLAFHEGAVQASSFGANLPKILLIVMGIFLIVIGNVMPKLRMNSMIGLRTSWSMKNERVWRSSQMMGGISFVLGGVILIIGSLLLPVEVAFFFMIIVISLDSIFAMIASYVFYRKDEARHEEMM